MCFYSGQNVSIKHKQRCEEQEINSIKRSNESHPYGKKKHFHKNSLGFGKYADFEADNEIDNSSVGNKTTNIYKQNLVCIGYYIVSELIVSLSDY